MTDVLQHHSHDEALKQRPAAVSTLSFGIVSFLADVVAILALSVLSGIAYHYVMYGDSGVIRNYVNIGLLVSLFFILPYMFRGEYNIFSYIGNKNYVGKMFYVWNFSFLCILALGFLTKETDFFSRGSVIIFYFTGFLALVSVRTLLVYVVRALCRSGRVAARRVFLAGPPHEIAKFRRQYNLVRLGLQLVDIALLPEAGQDTIRIGNRESSLDEELDRAVMRARALGVDDVIIVAPWSDTVTIDRCTDAFLTLPVSIHLGPERILDRFNDVRISRIGPMASLNLTRPPLTPLEILVKRALDIAAALAGLAVLAVPFGVIALLIKLDSPGPVLFFQRRKGFNQQPFSILKFRTMTVMEGGEQVLQATRHDARVTRAGRFLRRWSIDELPQLVNVIMGDMSIVGPRPHALVHDREFEHRVAAYARRHNVKPGITGWAQVNGCRGETDTDDKLRNRVEHDLYYIDNWSALFDLQIIALTVLSKKAFQNAY